MKVLILQLGDIHIKDSTDIILGRSKHIVDCLKNLEPDVDAAVCILSGDITQTGAPEEFSLALEFIEQIKTGLEKEFAKPIKLSFVAIPGNHDCYLAEATTAREVIMRAVQDTPSKLTDASFADICLAPQRPFFEFRD